MKKLITAICIALIIAASIGFYIYKQKTSRYIPSKALEAMPELTRSHYLKGKEYYYKKEFDRAIKEFKKSINVKPTAEAYCELAVSYMEKENFKTAIEYLEESIELNPKYPKSEYAIAVCYARIKPPDVKSAREHFARAKKLGYQVPEWFKRHLKRLEEE